MALTLVIPHGNHLRTYSKCQKDEEWKRSRNRKGQRERRRNGKKKIRQIQRETGKHICALEMQIYWKNEKFKKELERCGYVYITNLCHIFSFTFISSPFSCFKYRASSKFCLLLSVESFSNSISPLFFHL